MTTMATITIRAQSSARPFVSTIWKRNLRKQQPRSMEVRDASFQQQKNGESRRLVSFSLVFLHCLSIPQQYATAGSFLDKYVKRKKLEPLEFYIPVVILTQSQIEDLEKYLEDSQPEYGSCRNLLRSGPAASLRTTIRAVAQYASDNGNGKTAFQDVDQCLRALEELDSLLLRASRKDPGASVKLMRVEISSALDALGSLLSTVPSDELAKGKAIADAYRTPENDVAPENLDPEIKQLESIL